MFSYKPYGDGSLAGGWQAWFTQTGFEIEPQGGEESLGDSYHLTNASGSSIALQFHGTAIYLYGNTTSAYTVELDNSISSLSPGPSENHLLFSADDLNDTIHTINVTALPTDVGQQLAFDRAIVTATVPDQTAALVVDNQNTTVLHYSGSWSLTNDPQVPNTQHPSPFHVSTDAGDSMALNFTGAAAIAVNASTNYGHGPYNVTLDGVTSTHNGSTWWLVGNTMLAFSSGLDPSKFHVLEIVDAISPYKLTLNSVTLYGTNINFGTVALTNTPSASQSSSPSSSGASSQSASAAQGAAKHHTNAGVIAGPVVAGVVVFFFVAAFLFYRRRRVLARRRSLVRPSPYSESVRTDPPQPQWLLEKKAVEDVVAQPASRNHDDRSRGFGAEPRTRMQAETEATIGAGERGPAVTSSSAPSDINTNRAVGALPAPASSSDNVDINRIIELIAQRIDRTPQMPADVPDAPPPRYPEPMQ
ncbi:hypothetical protein EIP86_005484 [Pleurotus ostreatoroseus]|nr:hypothetical protein EIP86_005484 [Pleurotus ostreatoroseus]